MPPKKLRRVQEASPAVNSSEETHDISNSRRNNEPDKNAGAGLLKLPTELIDAILENYDVKCLSEFYGPDGHRAPNQSFFERTDALTALSQTCIALRNLTLHRLWERLDICRLPKDSSNRLWHQYTMSALERKANGIATSPVRHHVRQVDECFPARKF
jgi:hypothetical protein